MSKLSDLKKNRKNNLKKLQEKLEQQQSSGEAKDPRIWKPKLNMDKGKGTSTIRFLTPKNGEPYVEVKSYYFVGPGGTFYALAPQTIGKDDPVQIAAKNAFIKAKAEEDEKLKQYAKKFLTTSKFYANVYIIKDEETPSNEGKVFIYQFGRQIFKLIEKSIKPDFDDIDPVDPFDFWDGADLKIRMVAREMPDRRGNKIIVPNYENSEFSNSSPFLNGDEEKLSKIYEGTYDLSEFIDESKFKPFDELAAMFKKAEGKSYNWLSPEGVIEHVNNLQQAAEMESNNDEGFNDKPPFEPDENGEESAVDRFKRLANKSA